MDETRTGRNGPSRPIASRWLLSEPESHLRFSQSSLCDNLTAELRFGWYEHWHDQNSKSIRTRSNPNRLSGQPPYVFFRRLLRALANGIPPTPSDQRGSREAG